MRLPYFMRKKGTGMKTIASPPRSEEAPGVPSFEYICLVKSGNPLPNAERMTVFIAKADAAFIR